MSADESGARAADWQTSPLRRALLGELADVPPLPLIDFSMQEPAERWLVPRWIEETGIVLLSGRAKIGKTTLVAEVARSVASGASSCLGIPTTQRRVLWVDRDQGRRRCRQLFLRLRAGEIADLLVSSVSDLSLREPLGVRRLEAGIKEHVAGLVVLDSWSTLTPGADENSAADQTELFGSIRRLQDTYGCAFLIIHHSKKAGHDDSADPLARVRGSSAIPALVDTIIEARPVRSGTALEVSVQASRTDERPRAQVEYVREGDTITLRPGEPGTRVDAVEQFIVSLFCDDDRKLTRAQIVAAANKSGYAEKIIDKSLERLATSGALVKRVERGVYQLARFA